MLSASADLEESRLAADMIVHEVVGNGNPMGNLCPVKSIRQMDLMTACWTNCRFSLKRREGALRQ